MTKISFSEFIKLPHKNKHPIKGVSMRNNVKEKMNSIETEYTDTDAEICITDDIRKNTQKHLSSTFTYFKNGFDIVDSKDNEQEIFVNKTISYLDTIVVFLPDKIINVCNTLLKSVGEKEFSILCKGNWCKDGFEITDAYEIPKQTVGYSSVDYDHDDIYRLKNNGFNVVIHSHPKGCRSFSHEDESSINKNFLCSLLYNHGEIVDSRMCILLERCINICIKPDVEIISIENIEIPKEKLNNIEIKTYKSSSNYKHDRFEKDEDLDTYDYMSELSKFGYIL